MRYLKVLLFLVISLSLMFFITAFFMPGKMEVSSGINLDCTEHEVFSNLNKIQWDSKVFGYTKKTDIQSLAENLLIQKIEISKPLNFTAEIRYEIQKTDDGRRLFVKISGDLSFPIKRYFKVPLEARFLKAANQNLLQFKKTCS